VPMPCKTKAKPEHNAATRYPLGFFTFTSPIWHLAPSYPERAPQTGKTLPIDGIL
jgi:hypothetical protein